MFWIKSVNGIYIFIYLFIYSLTTLKRRTRFCDISISLSTWNRVIPIGHCETQQRLHWCVLQGTPDISWSISTNNSREHYGDVIIGKMTSQIASLTIVYSTAYSGADQRKHQNSASLAFVRGIHRGSVNSPHKWPVTRKMFPFDDVIMDTHGPLVRARYKCLPWDPSLNNILPSELVYCVRYRVIRKIKVYDIPAIWLTNILNSDINNIPWLPFHKRYLDRNRVTMYSNRI